MSTRQPGQMGIELAAAALLRDVLRECGTPVAYDVLRRSEKTAEAAGRDWIDAATMRAAMAAVADDVKLALDAMPPEGEDSSTQDEAGDASASSPDTRDG